MSGGRPSFDPGPLRAAWATSPATAARVAEDAARTVVLVPTGAVEQHGPHLPAGVDTWLAHAVALGVAERDGRVRVAEPLPYGCSSHHRRFPGTVTLRPSTFIALVVDVCRSLWGDGLLPVMLNGHGGNRAALEVALAELGPDGVRAAAFSYFDLVRDDLPELAREEVGHACRLESSLILHLWPAAVDADAVPPGGTPPSWPDPHLWASGGVSTWRPFDEINPAGVIGVPSAASAELGGRILEAAIARSTEVVARLRAAYAPDAGPRTEPGA
jgi:creatinine amidohydrolase